MFVSKKGSTLLDRKDTHNAFWCVTQNVNLTFVCLQENNTSHSGYQ